ncbi:MAG: C69 family dipeptidase [Eubacteriales bacterium]|nr:C69 family dipeptidase [Eubacteriales bacterium]
MCDTLIALGNSTQNGRIIFAKNSDRSPNERLLTERIPRKQHAPGSTVNCTYITIPQLSETYEVLLFRPHWIWGAEMGCNEYGVVIGNEAVFTREKPGEEALLGMDLLRLALERSKNAEEALNCIIRLLRTYGQGGNCAFAKNFRYDNSYLIADRSTAWVLETAGQYWAARKVKDVYSISNRLTIGKDYDRAHPDLFHHALDQGWCRSEDDFDFARCYTNSLVTRFSGAEKREHCTRAGLEARKGSITVASMMDILRSHTATFEEKPYQRASVSSVCMHAGGLVGDQTTGSFIAELAYPGEDLNEAATRDTYWITGSSAPCLSLFKPWWMIEPDHLSFSEAETKAALAYWERQEEIYRAVLEQRIDWEKYQFERNQIEETLLSEVGKADRNTSAIELAEIQHMALESEFDLRTRALAAAGKQEPGLEGNFYFRHYWKKTNKKLKRGI